MSSLNIFPTEILECITGVASTSQQMRLWQCGDRVLNYKLKNGGLKRTSLCWSGSTWMPWPRSYFTTLDSLVDVEWGVKFGTSLCPTLELNLLPKTLTRLHLVFDDVYILLRQQNVNMNDILPILESLHLSGRRLSEENLKNLPSNLIELHVVSDDAKIYSSRLFGDLPRHVEKLTLKCWIVDESELENDLPSRLVYLNIYDIQCNFNWFSKLPKSLKTLRLGTSSFDPDWTSLPPQLETFSTPSGMTKPSLHQLPQSLKTLEVSHIYNLAAEEDLGPLVPKNIKRFALVNDLVAHPALLPTHVTDFDGTVELTHPDMISFYGPETTKIRFRKGTCSDQLNLFPFPPKLQSLELYHINDDMCSMLPHGLRSLSILEGGCITTKGASKLPKSLTFLMVYCQIFDGNEPLSYLRHISNLNLRLKLSNFGNMTEKWVHSLLPSSSTPTGSDPDPRSTDTNLNHINPHLTSLSIFSNAFNHGSNHCGLIRKPFFDTLPRFPNLNTLSLHNLGHLPCDWFCLIPPNVTELDIRALSAHPTANQLSMLPKGLILLRLHVESEESKPCEWDDETLLALPRSLQILGITGPFPNVTKRMHEYLPPNLQSSSFMSDAPLDRLYGKKE